MSLKAKSASVHGSTQFFEAFLERLEERMPMPLSSQPSIVPAGVTLASLSPQPPNKRKSAPQPSSARYSQFIKRLIYGKPASAGTEPQRASLECEQRHPVNEDDWSVKAGNAFPYIIAEGEDQPLDKAELYRRGFVRFPAAPPPQQSILGGSYTVHGGTAFSSIVSQQHCTQPRRDRSARGSHE